MLGFDSSCLGTKRNILICLPFWFLLIFAQLPCSSVWEVGGTNPNVAVRRNMVSVVCKIEQKECKACSYGRLTLFSRCKAIQKQKDCAVLDKKKCWDQQHCVIVFWSFWNLDAVLRVRSWDTTGCIPDSVFRMTCRAHKFFWDLVGEFTGGEICE